MQLHNKVMYIYFIVLSLYIKNKSINSKNWIKTDKKYLQCIVQLCACFSLQRFYETHNLLLQKGDKLF